LEFGILGPLEVTDEGRSLRLGGPKQRALLAILLIHANEVVSTDRMIEGLWGERPPATAIKTLQVYVSQLRKHLGAETVVTRAPGYMLRVEDGHLDLERFEALTTEARGASPAVSSTKLREALALWRGSALADFAFEPFARSEIGRLEQLRLAAVEDRIEADLALGGGAELVPELEGLVAEHPLRERLRRQLMLALYRSGRQADALETYRQARTVLTDELGLEPSEALNDLQRAILAHDPSLDSAARQRTETEAAQVESSSGPGAFVGRERELRELLRSLDEAGAGEGRLILLTGEPGIGKSRLAEQLIRGARQQGLDVLVGRCWEAGGAPPYWPWVQALRTHVESVEPTVLRAEFGTGAGELAQLLPELREMFPDLSMPPALESEGARVRLFEAVAVFCRNASARRPLVIVLDDLHAADEPSLLLLRYLAREIESMHVLLLAALRDVAPIPSEPLTAMLAEATRESATRRLPLSGLNERDIAEYVELAAAEIASEELTAALNAETEGNPLFVTETVRLLALEGVRRDSTGGLIAVPQSLRDVIARRLAHLSERSNRVLVLAAVLGREFDLLTLAYMAGVDEGELLETLDEPMASASSRTSRASRTACASRMS
jgi:DNA-binding SARP family transcriptional activator